MKHQGIPTGVRSFDVLAASVMFALAAFLAVTMPTTYSVVGPCGSALSCYTSDPHVLARVVVLIAGAVVASLFQLLGRSEQNLGRDARILPIATTLTAVLAVMAALRYRHGLTPIAGGLELRSWLGYRITLASAATVVLALTVMWLVSIGSGGMQGLHLLSLLILVSTLVVAIAVPVIHGCSPSGWFYNPRLSMCVQANGIGRLGPAPAPWINLRWVERAVVILIGLTVAGFVRVLGDRIRTVGSWYVAVDVVSGGKRHR